MNRIKRIYILTLYEFRSKLYFLLFAVILVIAAFIYQKFSSSSPDWSMFAIFAINTPMIVLMPTSSFTLNDSVDRRYILLPLKRFDAALTRALIQILLCCLVFLLITFLSINFGFYFQFKETIYMNILFFTSFDYIMFIVKDLLNRKSNLKFNLINIISILLLVALVLFFSRITDVFLILSIILASLIIISLFTFRADIKPYKPLSKYGK